MTDFICLGSKITADGDCGHEIKRCLLLGRKDMTDLGSVLKSRDMSTEELMLLNCGVGEDSRVPWTARRSNQSILKEISPEYSLGELILKLKLQYFGHPV